MNVWTICDRCGFKVKRSEVRREANNFLVCQECYDGQYDSVRHPQNRVRVIGGDPKVYRDGRPDVHVSVSGPLWHPGMSTWVP